MRALISLAVTFAFIAALIAGAGIGVGFVLHWLLPDVDLGMSILIGLLVLALSVEGFMRFLRLSNAVRYAQEIENEFEEIAIDAPFFVRPAPAKRSRRKKA